MIKNEYAEKYLLYYADLLDKEAGRIIRSQNVASELEAERLMAFIDAITDQCILDEEEGKIILENEASMKDVEKVFIIITGILEEKGYESVVDRWRLKQWKSKT